MLKLHQLIGWLIARGFICTGLRALALRRYNRPGTVLSLCAHNPTPHVLDDLLGWLTRHNFSFVTTDDLLHNRLPPGRMAWLTFDDGWQGFDTALLPILEKYNIPATLFIAPAETERGYLWCNLVAAKVSRAEMYRQMTQTSEVQQLYLRTLYGEVIPQTLMPPETVCAIAKHPLVTIGNHSLTHASARYRPTEEVVAHAQEAQERLQRWCGSLTPLYCYPFGHRTPESDAALKKAGFIPIGLKPGKMTLDTLGTFRNMIYDDVTLAENTCRILNAWLPIRKT